MLTMTIHNNKSYTSGQKSSCQSTLYLKVLVFVSIWLHINAVREMVTDVPSVVTGHNVRRELVEGEDVLLTCVVSNIGSSTVIWSKTVNGKKRILSIDVLKLVHDDRLRILHDGGPKFNTSLVKGGDVWVLSLKNVTKSDTGGYSCRVNSSPPVQHYFMITVKPLATETAESKAPHNYTECCKEMGVEERCLGFCAISDILQGSTGVQPEKCENEFPKIVRCMADLRDHVPCCQNQGIPDVCQDLCRGEYTVQGDFVQTHFSCSSYTEATLLCISEGIEILPRAPDSPSAVSVSSTSIQVEWILPINSPPIDHFVINVTTITTFDPPAGVAIEKTSLDLHDDMPFIRPTKMQIKAPGNATHFKLEKLAPLTWYEISVFSTNKYGRSLPPYSVRVLTKSSVTNKNPIHPELPDVMACCKAKGVKHERCLQNLCNPHKRYIEQPDLMVCAAWATESFSCLAGDIDHTECCRERSLPQKCIELCSGNVTKLDYTYFKCVDYYSDYRSCLLKGYGVLPGPPKMVAASNINTNFALLSWNPPEQNTKSITSYHSYFRPIDPTKYCTKYSNRNIMTAFHGVHAVTSPTVLEDLCPDTQYEVYVQAFNTHGISDPSSRVIFRTLKQETDTNVTEPYNVTQCCQQVKISPGCFPLCSYNPRMAQVRSLARTCKPEIASVLRCVVGGRDHRSCCARRGVPDSCNSLCAGTFHGKKNSGVGCLPYIGNIMLCLEEGIGVLPAPIVGLHATDIRDGGLTMVWEPPVGGANSTYYQVNYQAVDNFSSTHYVYALNNTLNITTPVAIIDGLEKGIIYNFFVISGNDWGTSLPSSLLTVNLTKEEMSKGVVAGVPSAPHSIILDSKTATSLTILWQPPAVSLPTDRFRYYIHVASLSNKNETPRYNITQSGATALHLTDLAPNTQYVIFVSAHSDMGESRPSETILAWTDPAYPAFVEKPTVHPTNQVVEGGSMTVLCIAMGSPSPNVSLYISGKLVHEDITRHMVTKINNVTRDMTDIACYADNGYGTPMQSTVKIVISHRPTIVADEVVRAAVDQEAVLECTVNAWPEPSMIWWVNPESRVPVIHGGNISIETVNMKPGIYVMKLTVKYALDKDYFCKATNALGSFTHTVKLKTFKEVKMQLDVSDCCIASNVSSACLNACDFDQIDFHEVMNRDECIPDFGKFLKCGADGSDHRGCCSKSGVPVPCLDWCRGKSVPEERFYKMCLLQWIPIIFQCFHEGQESLPGPPVNLNFVTLSGTSARISWNTPIKNPESVELYRVFWRANGTRYPFRIDTAGRTIVVNNLTEGIAYEVAVKAGNIDGTSVLSETKTFIHTLSYISSLTTSSTNHVGVALGVFFCLSFVLAVGGTAFWVIRRRQMFGKVNGISFANPSYIREQSGDAVQIAETPSGSLNGSISPNGSMSPNGSVLNGATNGEIVHGGIWNTQSSNPVGPGFDNDINPKGGYSRFKS